MVTYVLYIHLVSIELDGRRQRSVASRAAILDAAERLFSEGGYHATSLRTIASSIGMSHAGVLKHFSSKGELLAAILQRLEVDADAPELPAGLSAREGIRLIMEHTVAQQTAVHLRVVLLGEAMEGDHPAHDWVQGQLRRVESELTHGLGVDGTELLALWNGLQLVAMYLPEIDSIGITDSHYASIADPDPDRPPAATSAVLRRGPASDNPTREQEIVQAATRAFAHSGYRGAGLREIAADVDLTHGALLYHFPTKLDLLTAVIEERDRDESLPWSWEANGLDYLNGMYLQALHNEQHPGLARLFSTLVCEATDAEHPAHAYFRTRYLRFHGELRDALSELVATGLARPGVDPDAEAFALIALWEGLGLRGSYLVDETGLPERLRSHLDALLTVTLSHA